jgi:hypothetical protein
MGQGSRTPGVDDCLRAGDDAGLVGVLDAQDEGAALVASEEPVEEGSADIAHVGLAGGTGGVANAHAHHVAILAWA